MIVLKNAALIDGTGAAPIEGASVIIRGASILAAGQELPIPEGAHVIDLTGMTLMPGLSDAHTHFGGSDTFDRPGLSGSFSTYDYAAARSAALRWGVTTVRSAGDFMPDILDFRAKAAAENLPSPRILAAGKMIYAQGGHPGYSVFFEDPAVLEHASVVCGEETDLAKEVGALCKAGADWIKAFVSDDNKLKFPDTKSPRLSVKALRLITDTAHKYGVPVMIHVDDMGDMEYALQAEVDCIEHVINVATVTGHELSDETLKLLLSRGVWVVPTMVGTHRHEGSIAGAPPVYPTLVKAVGQMIRAGVNLGVGCDSGIPFVPIGESLHAELELLVSAGMTPLQAITAATGGNARLFRAENAFGAVRPGLAADLVAVGKDPLSDISNTRDIRLVLRGGKIVFDNLPES